MSGSVCTSNSQCGPSLECIFDSDRQQSFCQPNASTSDRFTIILAVLGSLIVFIVAVLWCTRSRKDKNAARWTTLDPKVNKFGPFQTFKKDKSLDLYFKTSTVAIDIPKLPAIKSLDPVVVPMPEIETPTVVRLSIIDTIDSPKPSGIPSSHTESNAPEPQAAKLLPTIAPVKLRERPQVKAILDVPKLPTIERIVKEVQDKQPKPRWSINDTKEIDIEQLIQSKSTNN